MVTGAGLMVRVPFGGILMPRLSLLCFAALLAVGALFITGKPQQAFSQAPAFKLTTPTDGAMITDTRKVALKWNADAAADHYEAWVNITRNDYDWTASGSLLDRYTKLGETKDTTFTTTDLVDRWTYKAYIVAVRGDGTTVKSNIVTFSVYLPVLTTMNDGIAVINGCRDLNKDGKIEPYEDWHNPPDVRVKDLMSRMTDEEKAYQMFYNSKEFPLAGFMMGPCATNDLTNFQIAAAKTRLGIPEVTAGDTVDGFKTSFPAQSAFAAMRDYNIVWKCGNIEREEGCVVGERGTLSPLAEVGTKVLYPRIQEGNGEDADVAAAIVRALVCGIQGGPEINPTSMLVDLKHWPGQGAGGEGNVCFDAVTIKYHMKPWIAGLEAGAGQIMPGYAACQFLDPGGPSAGESKPIMDYLRNNLGFKGLICTDWLGAGQWVGCGKAGADVLGGASPGGITMATFVAGIGQDRLNESVARILSTKFRMGIFEDPYGTPDKALSVWHTKDKEAVVEQAERECMTLLKNDGTLPLRLKKGDNIEVKGDCDDGARYVLWMSGFHKEYGAQTILQAITARAAQAGVTVNGGGAPKAAIVVAGEPWYTHGSAWAKEAPFIPQAGMIQDYHDKGIPVVVVLILPRPYIITDWNDAASSIVVCYRCGDGGGPAVAQCLFGDYEPHGKLSWQLPRSMAQVGSDSPNNEIEKWDLPFDVGATDAERAEIRAKIDAGEKVLPIYGKPLYQYGAGLDGFGIKDTTPPLAFNTLTPAEGTKIENVPPTLTWQASSDPESNIRGYNVYMDQKLLASKLYDTSYTLTAAQLSNGKHLWNVEAVNWTGLITKSNSANFEYVDNIPPRPFDLSQPADAAKLTGATQSLAWASSIDNESGLDHYEVWLDGAKVATLPAVGGKATGANLALNAKVDATSSTGAGRGADAATDGNAGTRWESASTDPQSITVDLGKNTLIAGVTLNWETACAADYTIQVSTDGTSWKEIYSKEGGRGGVEKLTNLSGYGRYVRMNGTRRATAYGYSLFEFEVYGNPVSEYQLTDLKPGAHTWYVVAVDASGNTQKSTSTRTFTVQ